MRLLKCTQPAIESTAAVFSLIEFQPANIPPVYAILSHRWTSDEVTYEDITTGNASSREGYQKLEFCAKQAAQDGIVYFWIDTCCINKADFTELSEAINSMYKWYQRATKCYVYMLDVSIRDSSGTETARQEWKQDFRNSVWFTRGWTLQELLAPSIIEFFSKEGLLLGDKVSLEDDLEQASGIPVAVFKGAPLAQFGDQERLSWAAKRTTTKEEDPAYCLLGIFDIHMALIYGEGRQKAMNRLQREILAATTGRMSLTEDRPWLVPFERNDRFTGREKELATIEERLFSRDRTSRWAIVGLGGVGKTQLAIELVHRVRYKCRDCTILWIPAISAEGLRQGFAAAAQTLDIPGNDDQNTDPIELIRDYLSNMKSGRWLLVIDNADDIALWTTPQVEESATQRCSQTLIDCLPHNERGSVIVTTRDRKVGTTFAASNLVQLSVMDEEIALDLFNRYLVEPVPSTRRSSAMQLVNEFACVPLALSQAAASMNVNQWTVQEYLEFLHDREEEVIDLLSENFRDEGRYRETSNAIATTWLISFDQIREQNAFAADYLASMACLYHKGIPQSLLPSGSSRRKELEAISILSRYSFISRHSVDSTIDLHPLVHLATRNWLRKQAMLELWQSRTLSQVWSVFSRANKEDLGPWRSYLPHVKHTLESQYSENSCEERTSLLNAYAIFVCRDGRMNEATHAFTQLLSIQTATLNEEDLLNSRTKSELANSYRIQGRYSEAEKLFLDQIEAGKRKHGVNHPHTLHDMIYLATVYMNQCRYKEAEDLYLLAVGPLKDCLGISHPEGLAGIQNMAVLYVYQGRYQEAEQLLLEVIKTQPMDSCVDLPQNLMIINNLAQAYGGQGRYSEAEELLRAVVDLQMAKLGADHPDTMLSTNNLAVMYQSQRKYEEGEGLFLEVIKAWTMKLGGEHPHTLLSVNNLALVYQRQGRYQEAERLLLEVIGTKVTKQGADHPSTLASMNNLALVYQGQERHQEAEELLSQVMEAQTAKQGVDHPDTLTSIHNLAFTKKSLGQEGQALSLMKKCVQGR